MWRGREIIVAFIAFSMLLFGHNVLAAEKDAPQKTRENAEQEAPVLDVQKSPDDISEGREG